MYVSLQRQKAATTVIVIDFMFPFSLVILLFCLFLHKNHACIRQPALYTNFLAWRTMTIFILQYVYYYA